MTSRLYIYYSPLHRVHSRIDYILCSDSLIHCCESADIGLKLISDHSLITSSFSFHPPNTGGYHWSMPKFVLDDEISKLHSDSNFESDIKQYFILNLDCGVAPEMIWDAFKADDISGFSLQEEKKQNDDED